MAFVDATCPNCHRRYGWHNELRPACPCCGHVIPEDPEVEERIKKLTEEMLKDEVSDGTVIEEKKKMKILAFGHRKRVGKDTACRYASTHLRVTHNTRDVQKKGFADKVKAQCYDLFAWAGLQPGYFYEEKENEKKRDEILPLIGKTPRDLWISHGMAARSYYPNVWIDAVLQGTKCDFLLISDLRFPNEANKIQELGGWVVKIENPRVQHTSDPADDPLLNWTGWDLVIHNDDTHQIFNERIVFLINLMLRKP